MDYRKLHGKNFVLTVVLVKSPSDCPDAPFPDPPRMIMLVKKNTSTTFMTPRAM